MKKKKKTIRGSKICLNIHIQWPLFSLFECTHQDRHKLMYNSIRFLLIRFLILLKFHDKFISIVFNVFFIILNKINYCRQLRVVELLKVTFAEVIYN